MLRPRLYIFLAVLIVSFFGCKPQPVFPIEPDLKFKEYIQHPGSDSLQVVFTFTDGDGDIGVALNSEDSNMVLTVYHRNSAGIDQVVDNPGTQAVDSLYYPYRIPHLTPGLSGLEGEIYVTIDRSILRTVQDTVSFKAFLLDNSDHRSQFVMTDQVYLLP